MKLAKSSLGHKTKRMLINADLEELKLILIIVHITHYEEISSVTHG